jgi:hypothetical protein
VELTVDDRYNPGVTTESLFLVGFLLAAGLLVRVFWLICEIWGE